MTTLRVYRLDETVRKFNYSLLTAGYEVVDGERVVAQADVQEGMIQVFACSPEFSQHTRALVLGGMMKTIIQDAESTNSNLSIALVEDGEHLNKRFLERFGFRKDLGDTMIRIAGAISPPTVV